MAKFDVIAWMAEKGRTSYRDQIGTLAAIAGTHRDDPWLVDFLNTKIEEIRGEAQARYDDWASDPFP